MIKARLVSLKRNKPEVSEVTRLTALPREGDFMDYDGKERKVVKITHCPHAIEPYVRVYLSQSVS